MTVAIRTTCPYCGVGCGVLATPGEIVGDPQHPANFGKLCVKGSALAETIGLEGRLLHPELRDRPPPGLPPPEAGGGERQRVSWDTALDHVAQGFARTIAEHGPGSVAFYVSGQLLTEDYYVANKLMKGFIGSANIDTNSRLCMSSAVAGHKRAFGEDVVPVGYEDLEQADLVVLVGSNTAWCHPILFQRLEKARELDPARKLVVIDPRRTATCEAADLHLPIKPGTDVALFNGLLAWLHEHGVGDADFTSKHTNGLDAALAAARRGGAIADVAKLCGLDPSAVAEFFCLFARTARVVTAFSQGVNQSSQGTDKVNAIINCHLLTGRIGKPGAGPFSITGQPNAMGGREVGGLANMLAAHLELGEPLHRQLVQEFWQSPRIAEKPGLKAVDLFEAIHAGKVKAVWIMATNPVVSLPDADRVREALERCPLVVVSDVVRDTDTNRLAHVLLPAAAWGEKDGTVTNSERVISRQRAFLPVPGEAKPDWWIVTEVARRMGFADAFGYQAPGEIFDEHARLSAYRNGQESGHAVPRYFDLSGVVGLGAAGYDGLRPVSWPLPPGSRLPLPGSRIFADGTFAHPDGRARFVAVNAQMPVNPVSEEFPLALNTGRIRDQWHTMTRTGRSPKLATHIAEPFVDLHPHDALSSGVREGELARVSTRWGSLVARVVHGGGIARGQAFVPIHWSGMSASDARVGALVNPVVDPVSGEPEFKHTPARVEPFDVAWHGFVLVRGSRAVVAADLGTAWWTRIAGAQFVRYEIAGRARVADPSAWSRAALQPTADEDWIDYEDRSAGVYRAALLHGDRMEACLFLSPRSDLPSRAWLAGLFAKERIEEADRVGLLVGEPLDRGADTGPTVCSCFGVGRNVILDAIRRKDCRTPAQVTACVKAGGNCGSCVPEIRKLIAEAAVAP